MLNRRNLLKSTALALSSSPFLASSLSAQIVGGDSAQLIRKAIPSTGETIPIIGIGTNHYGHGIGEGNDAELMAPLRETLAKYAEYGSGLIDTSVRYRNSEEVLGTLFDELGLTNQFFISTKISGSNAEETREQLEQALLKLRADVLDIVSVHNLVEWQTNIPLLREAKSEGKLRYIGISTADIPEYEEVIRAMETEPLDFIQINYSLRERLVEDKILGLAAEKGIAVVINRPFDQGRVFSDVNGHEVPEWASDFDASSWGQVFLKYVASHPAVVSVIAGTTKVHHLIDNMGAAQGRLPTAEQRKQIEDHYAAIVAL
jgi:aryl-alcohol dehydrogenase-like predicted oxidoreductase